MGDLSKSKLSKTVALLCVVILLGSLLTGCGIPLTAKQLEDQSSGAANDSATTNPPADSTTGSTNSSENGSVTTPEINGSAATVLTSDTTNSGQAYRSDQPDQNALRIENGAQVTLSESTVQKTGDSTSVENSAFYGLNAGILVRDGGVLTLSGGIITTNATGATGLFVYNSGSLATVSNCTINTSSNNSGGIQVAGGGQISANNLSVTTQGNSAPALRSDRGGGNIIVDQGIYTSNGIGSPAIYCTANILVSNARLAANNSEAVVIDGANVVALSNCQLNSAMFHSGGSVSDNLQAVMIYQSSTATTNRGTGSFSMSGGSLVCQNGDTFYVTNTTANISLNNVALSNANGNVLTVAGNDGSRGWGSFGQNGGKCTLTTTSQTLTGNIVVDSISSLDLHLQSATAFTGTINTGGAAGQVSVTLAADSSWVLTADAYITAFQGNTAQITANGHHVYVNGQAII